ncbi:hypothetical protein DL96DRAFT_1226613 [Flagelloscypha sp. PMI_526]|nr:hypothetical protein DL96DRAFT_1226613 [Flagelloscypha sp. PMI_526]
MPLDPSAKNLNLTVDDFDSIVTYKNQSEWSTPDPMAPTFAPVKWSQGTYHMTTVSGAEFTYNFTGATLDIFGGKGPRYGQFQVAIDSGSPETVTSYAEDSSFNDAPTLLYSKQDLGYGNHSVIVKSLGKGDTQGEGQFLFDYLQSGFQAGPAGATITNTTLEETDSRIKYSGKWSNNTSELFHGGGTMYTNENGASFELDFEGTAIYLFGDKKNDHRTYTVTLDGTATTLNGISGCGGEFGLTCEKQVPSIKFFAASLGSGNHNLKLVNNADNASFFDLDYIVISSSDKAGAVPTASSSGSGSSSTGTSSGSSSAPNGALHAFASANIHWLLLLQFLFVLRMLRR